MLPRTALLLTCLGLTACAQQDDASPLADAGPSLHGKPGQPFLFDGSSSIADTWSWTLVLVPEGSVLGPGDLQDADTPWPVLIPDVDGLYRLSLEVCTPHACVRSWSEALVGPESLLAADRMDLLGAVSKASDPLHLEGLHPNWGPHDHDPVEFRSNFGFKHRKDNKAPIAIASWDKLDGETIDLLGDDSYDPDGDTLRYRWTFTIIPAASRLDSSALESADSSIAQFTPDVSGVWVLRLTVRDSSHRASTTVILEP